MWFRRSLKNSGTPSYPEKTRRHKKQFLLMSPQRQRFPGCRGDCEGGGRGAAAPTGECVDVDHCVLARLVVDNNIDAKQGHAQRLPQRPGQLPDHVIVGWLRHSLHVLSLRGATTSVNSTHTHPRRKHSVLTNEKKSYRGQVRGGLRLGHIVAVEENGFSV